MIVPMKGELHIAGDARHHASLNNTSDADVKKIAGSGFMGQITLADVKAYIKEQSAPKTAETPAETKAK